MFISEMDAHGHSVRAENPTASSNNGMRISASSNISLSSTDKESYATAEDSPQRRSSSSGVGSGLGISGLNKRRASAPRMGSSSTITASAAAQGAGNWPGGIMRQVDVRVESRELEQLDAELRRRSQNLPRESRWTVAGDHETISELTAFLRNVTPPPSNLMSLPSPTASSLSSMSSIRRRKGGIKTGAIMKMVRLFKRGGNKKLPPRPNSRSLHRSSSRSPPRPNLSLQKRLPSPPLGLKRSHAVRGKRPPRIKLPDTAIAGRTIDGHRHIAISIPIEHAYLGYESRHDYPSPIGRTRTRSMSSADNSSPRVYDDIHYNSRPLTTFIAEPHIGTQLGPLAEERESLSSRSWEKGSSNGSGQGEAVMARKVRLASRNTFGTVHEELSRPNTSSTMLLQASPPQTSDGPMTPPRTSDEMRSRAHRQTLAALAGGGPPIRPAAGSVSQRPVSAHSFRSFTASSPSRIYYPMRKSSLHPSAAAADTRRPRTMSSTTGETNNSRDSSREQTLQESIFSERSYLESLDTVNTGNLKEELRHAPLLLSEAALARGLEGQDVVEFGSRSSVDSQRRKSRENRQSGSSHFSASSREKRRSGSSRASKNDKGRQRRSYESPVAMRPEKRHSGGSTDTGKQRESGDGRNVTRHEERLSRGSMASASATFGKSDLASDVMTRESAVAVAAKALQEAGEIQEQAAPTTLRPGQRSGSFGELAPIPRPGDTGEHTEGHDVQAQRQAQPEIKGKGKEIQDQQREPPSIEVQQATPTEANMGQKPNSSLSRRKRASTGRAGEPEPQTPAVGALVVPHKRSGSRENRKDKGKQQEASPAQPVEEVKRPTTPEGQTTEAKNMSPGPIPSPKERRDLRKSILLSRQDRVAELKAALDKPGSQPSDLVLERKLSVSSISSSGSTPRMARMDKKRESFPYAHTILTPIAQRTPPKELSFTKVLTVADVEPSTPPEVELVRKVSISLSVSSPATVSGFPKASPIPPYQSIGSVTPPDSPTNSLSMPSPSLQFSTIDLQTTSLRHPPPSPTNGRVARRRSGRTSPTFSGGRRSPIATLQNSPPRPKTAGKGALASKKAFFEGMADSAQSSLERNDSIAGPSTAKGKSILKMSRSEIFDRYEALREKQTRDMEKRIRRLERNGDYWLTSMLPILNDMTHALKIVVGEYEQVDKGKGKEADRDRTVTRYNDGRQSRAAARNFGVEPAPRRMRHRAQEAAIRSDDSFDPDEFIVRHGTFPSRGRSEVAQERQRLYLHDDATLGQDRNYPIHRYATSEARSFSMNNIRRRKSPMPFLPADPQQYSGSTTVVGSSTARGNLSARPSSKRASTSPNLHDDLHTEEDRLARLERISEQIDAEIRRLPLTPSSPSLRSKSLVARDRTISGPRRMSLSMNSEESLRTYQGSDADTSAIEEQPWGRHRGGNGRSRIVRADSFDTIEPLMRELQIAGSRVSMESPKSEDLGDNEVRKMRERLGPRAVVGFGAFSM